MKKLIFLLIAVPLVNITLAQSETKSIEEEIIELMNYHILGIDNQVNANVAMLNQLGADNNIVAIQQNSGWSLNQILSIQQGYNNIGYIEESGDGHNVLLQQNGLNNEANIWSVGSETSTWAIQQGNGNVINSYIDNEGLLPKAAILQQIGNNNQIDLALLGNGMLWNSWPRAAYVKQTGDDLGVTAIFDSYQYPVYIEQQAGINGGMNINVSTSAFSFPMKRY